MRMPCTLEHLESLVKFYHQVVNVPSIRILRMEDELGDIFGLYWGPVARKPFVVGDPDQLCMYVTGRLDEAEKSLHGGDA